MFYQASPSYRLQNRPSWCITVKPVMSALYWPVCLTDGPLLHVPYSSRAAVLKSAPSSRLTTFPPCSESLTVLLELNEEEFSLPWQNISHSLWQLWQLVMAACWWELCKPPTPPLPSQALLLLLVSPSCGALEMPNSLYDKNNKMAK